TDENGEEMQEVEIELTDAGFAPAVAVVQSGLITRWHVVNNASSGAQGAAQLLVPNYVTQIDLDAGENPLYLQPDDSFDFSTGDNAFYGYMKVVDDLDAVDVEAIRAEVAAYQTLIWPPETFEGGEAGCH
ncbi:MAG: cupredoxin domain-containing protein, partial [Oscillospiraceae bacterium]|nr:cupredoxin domain-containing protein [Oscillospiraceae bacterium]